MSRTFWRGFSVTVAAVVALSACGDSDDANESAPTTTPSTLAAATSTSAAEVTTTTTPGFPEAQITATIGDPYTNAAGGTFDAETFGIADGAITAAWYAVGNYWAVLYQGLDPEQASGKCLGNSLGVPETFEFVTNSPYGALACQGFETKVLPPGAVHLCGDSIIYTTEIPTSEQGDLYASIEQALPDGTIQGMTSAVAADPGKAVIAPIDADCQVIS